MSIYELYSKYICVSRIEIMHEPIDRTFVCSYIIIIMKNGCSLEAKLCIESCHGSKNRTCAFPLPNPTLPFVPRSASQIPLLPYMVMMTMMMVVVVVVRCNLPVLPFPWMPRRGHIGNSQGTSHRVWPTGTRPILSGIPTLAWPGIHYLKLVHDGCC